MLPSPPPMPLSSSASRLAPSLLALLSLTVSTLTPRAAGAVGTRWFQLETLEDLRGGDLSAVSVDTTGTVRPGLRLDTLALPEPSSVWCSLVLPDGSVLLGTGSEGNVYRVAQGQAALVASTGALAVSSLSFRKTISRIFPAQS